MVPTPTLSQKHMEREQMMMMMKTTKSGKEEKEEKCRSGDEIVWTHSASAGVDHLLKHDGDSDARVGDDQRERRVFGVVRRVGDIREHVFREGSV